MGTNTIFKVFAAKLLYPRNVAVFGIIAMILFLAAFSHPNSDSFSLSSPLSSGNVKTSRIHYLIPSTISKPPVCASIASALVNRYPIPVIVGYKGEGEFDSGKAHIAKIPAIQRYLHSLTDSDDDDLVMIMDSFDVLAQVPAQAMIERYFDLRAKADQRLADQRGITIEELHKRGLRQTILWGSGKICSPMDTRCDVVPYSGLPRYAYGPRSDDSSMVFTDSRHLNSGTVIAPLGDLRKLIDATQRLIKDTYTLQNPGRNKDQFYISTIYGRQEYQRTLDMNEGVYPYDVWMREPVLLPEKKQGENDITEYHIFVEFESTFTQTQCFNERWMRSVSFNNYDMTASVIDDPYDEGRSHWRPFKIQMPLLIYQAMTRIFRSLSEAEPQYVKEREWVQNLPMGVNIGSQVIFSFYHNTCKKDKFLERYQAFWFFPIVKPLLRVAKQAIQDREPLHPGLVDGRKWMAAKQYPANMMLDDEFGGVFTDFEPEPFIPFQEFCKENITAIIGA